MNSKTEQLFKGNRKTVGLLLDNLSIGFTSLFWKQIHRLSIDHNINLVMLPCDINNNSFPQVMRTIGFTQNQSFDGLIVLANTITTFLTTEQLESILKTYISIPTVAIGVEIEAALCSILVDQRKGFEEALRYLFEQMHCKRIGFVKGNIHHTHTIERLAIYKEQLEKYNMPFDESLVAQGDFFLESGSEAVRVLLDERNLILDAIVCCNDEMAIGAMKALNERGIFPPDKIRLIGYDNIPDIQYEGSTLATVSQPINAMAEKAIELIIAAIDQQHIPKTITMDSEFIWRASAGFSQTNLGIGYSSKQLVSRAESLVKANDFASHNNFSSLKDTRILQSLMIEGVHQFMAAQTEEKLLAVIQREMPKLEINTFVIGFFERNAKESETADYVRLLWGYNRSTQFSKLFKQDFLAYHILPEEYDLEADRYTMILEPLFYANQCYGYIFYEVSVCIGSIYETIRRQIASALNVIYLLDEQVVINQSLLSTLESLKQTQNQLIQSEKMAALGTLVAGVAHEINTPIGIGVSAASYLDIQTHKLKEALMQGSLTKNSFETFIKAAEETCSILMVNLKKAAQLISSFKNIAVDQTSEDLREFDLKNYIDEVLLSLKPRLKKKQIKVEFDCSESINVKSYPGALSQILTNLVINALVHGFEYTDFGIIKITAITVNNTVNIQVSDNGCGIESTNLGRIFDPFYTTKRGTGGSGLGLNIVYNLVTQTLKGNIICQSSMNEGTTFSITFPMRLNELGGH